LAKQVNMKISYLLYFFAICFFASCGVRIKKAPKNQYFFYKNEKIEVNANNLSKKEKKALAASLFNNIDDSAKVTIKKSFLILNTLKKPNVFDTQYCNLSAKNMQQAMQHLGYYAAKVTYDTAIIKKSRTKNLGIAVTYNVDAGKLTLIDTVNYKLKREEFQQIALKSREQSFLQKKKPVTKTAVLTEVARLVDSFRNNGYYKFTATELRVLGDSTFEALTTVSDDPFEQFALLEEAQKKRDSPTVKLAIVLNKGVDTTKVLPYVLGKIYVITDYRPGDDFMDTVNLATTVNKKFIEKYHQPLFKTKILEENITFNTGELYKQNAFAETVTNLNALGAWQNVNIRLVDAADSVGKVNVVIELIPAKKFSNSASFEASYSTSNNISNPLGGNLFGFGLNASVVNRNFAKQSIRMTHSIRAGLELNNSKLTRLTNPINSTELTYTNNTTLPKILTLKKPLRYLGFNKGESFINTNLGYVNRLNFFSLQNINLNLGVAAVDKKQHRLTIRFNTEFSLLYNQSQQFIDLLNANPFLQYSYNTSTIYGFGLTFTSQKQIKNGVSRSLKINAEESGLTIGQINIFEKYKKHYLKTDLEYKRNKLLKRNSSLASRAFVGVGIPFKNDDALPFFKQYFGGGSNSMRGWPLRGVGRGNQKLLPFGTSNTFNDKTGDIQLEFNVELRHKIATLITDFLDLNGAFFVDAGNIWNFKDDINSSGVSSGAKFEFKNIYKQIGLSGGYGLRLNLTGVIIRTDFSFRFKRPETSDINNGWKPPSIGFDDAFGKIFRRSGREWRYENFNLTVGISYPF
jgi:outer membrane protein insertion porin family